MGYNSNDGSEKKKVCFYCNSGEHVSLYDCEDFKALILSDRVSLLMKSIYATNV